MFLRRNMMSLGVVWSWCRRAGNSDGLGARGGGSVGFYGDAKAVCDSVDVSVVGGGFGDVQDVQIAEAVGSQGLDVGLSYVGWCASQLQRVGEHGFTTGIEARSVVQLEFNRGCQLVVS